MAQVVSQPRPAAIAAVLARSHQWTSARRKSDGRPFYFVPSTTSDAVYMTATDGCTCPAAQRFSGPCKHSVAVAQYLARRAQKSDAALLEQLKADQRDHAKVLCLTGWERDELMDNPTYAQRAHWIARLESAAAAVAA